MTPRLSKLLEWFEIEKIEYLKNRTRFFDEILILQKNYMFRCLQEVTFHFIEEATFKNI